VNNPQEFEAHIRELIRDGKLHDAAVACDQMNQQFPEFEIGWYTSSHLAMKLNQPQLAVRAIDRAIQLSPGKPEWLFQRVEILAAMGDLTAARETAEQLSDHSFQSASVAASFARSLSYLGMHEASRRHCRRAVELEPNESQYHFSLAAAERSLGNIRAAHDAVTRCIELHPGHDEAHLFRSGLETQSAEANNVDSLLEAYARPEGGARHQMIICFALAKELDDIGEYRKSFDFLSKGASLRRSHMQYEPEKDLDAIKIIQEIYTSEKFDGHIEGHINAAPIFVIGMPRTGTTLVQRILGSHSVVHSAGELESFSLELEEHCKHALEEELDTLADLVAVSPAIDFMALGEGYIAGTRLHAGTSAHFVDSFPMNFLYAGLIHLALPKAKIVLLERDPMDTCYTLFKNLFDGSYPYSFDLEELANYVVAYHRLIDHWQTVIPGVMHIVNYEELVTKPRPVVEGLLNYCGLSWEDACMQFYEGAHAPTASSEAKARNMYFQSTIGKWRNYEDQLKPVSDILGELN
jgi:tetratricopeptide (TPR) repeat protein